MRGIKMVVTRLMCLVAVVAKVVQTGELRMDLLHQSDYDVKLERTELVWYNRSYSSDAKLGLVWYNRTQRVHNGSFNSLVDLSYNLTVHVQAYKFMSNEYRFFPMTVGTNLCKEYQRNSFDAKTILDKSSNIRSCPPKKGSYYIHNAILDYSRWPPFIPRGAYKIVAKLYNNADFDAEIHAYLSIMDKPLKWIN